MIVSSRLQDAGIDYVRLTSATTSGAVALRDFYCKIRDADKVAGYKEAKGGAFGFVGDKTRHALYGVKEGWTMLQVSGAAAKRSSLLAAFDTQCTRLDLQLTYRVEADSVGDAMEDIYMSLVHTKKAACRPRRVTRIQQGYATQTIYVGSRASDVFIRIYDKYEESGKEEHKDCIRFELELKGRVSKAVWRKLQNNETTLGRMLHMVHSECERAGVEMPTDTISEDVSLIPSREATPIERTRDWLAVMLPKAVARVSAEFGHYSVLRMLFSQTFDDYYMSGIIKLLSVTSGS